MESKQVAKKEKKFRVNAKYVILTWVIPNYDQL